MEKLEAVYEWEGDPAAGAKALADYFKEQGWESGWFLGANYYAFRSLHLESRRLVRGKIAKREHKGMLARFKRPPKTCRVSLNADSEHGDAKELLATAQKILNSVSS